MINKKISVVPAIALLFLAGCGTNNSTSQDSTVSNTSTNSTTTLTSSSSASKFSWTQTLDMAQNYDYGGGQATLKWKVNLENWIIKSVDVIDAQGPIKAFADWINSKVVWKNIEWLQVDTITGASLTTAAFNQYLKDLNK